MKINKLAKEKFPKALLEIPQPPENLWIMGDLPTGNPTYLCVVGSRRCTSYGREACEKIISGLRGYPIVIVSGFAMGIDTIAHQQAMKIGLPTVVFPGSGLSSEVIYPKSNIKLAEEVVKKGGCLLSEFEPDFVATQWSFPQRNRLMAGISKAVLVVEGERKSGSLITARLATEYSREVLAIPGSIFAPYCQGTNYLIHQGATSVTCAEDVLDALGFPQTQKPKKQESLFEDLSPEEKKVISLLREPMPRDELIRNLKMNISMANVLLSAMEIKGIIKEELSEIKLRN
jgi:DNA processing protein